MCRFCFVWPVSPLHTPEFQLALSERPSLNAPAPPFTDAAQHEQAQSAGVLEK
jgi:hypothetical protein